MAENSNNSSEGNGLKWVGTHQVRPDGVDKVTGRASFGADMYAPNMLIGKILRSPHAHARIVSMDTSRAEALEGVKAVVTKNDICDLPSEMVPAGEMMVNYRDITRNVMAREKVLYEGHAVSGRGKGNPPSASARIGRRFSTRWGFSGSVGVGHDAGPYPYLESEVVLV